MGSPHLAGDSGISLLQYADDTIIMVEGSETDISNLKFLLLCFQHLSGLKINFDKSDVMAMGYSPAECLDIANRLNCRLGSFPTTYLGTPISDSRLTVAGFRPTVAKLQTRMEPWQGRWMSKAARTILINSSLSSLLLFLMSFYSLQETLHHEIAKIQSCFYWAGDNNKQKYNMVSWPDICMPRDQGGLGIMCSKRMNIALLSRWLWRISQGHGGLLLDIIWSKYLRGQPLAFCQRSGGSQFWQSVIQLLPVLHIGTSISVGSGTATLFWFDRWAGGSSFAARFPDIFSIAVDPQISVERALIDLGRLAFCRTFGPSDSAAWHELLECVALHEPVVDAGLDLTQWRLEPSGQFSTKSLYQAIAPSTTPPPLTTVWSIRLPLKIQIFMWQWIHGQTPSGVEVRKRNGPRSGLYPLCDVPEDSNHIFFSCMSVQFVWSCFREVVGGNWCHTNFPDLFAKL